MSRLFSIVQSLFQKAGIRIAFDHPVRNAPKLFAHKCAEHGVKTVLDIGANKGQFGVELRQQGYRGRLISFEPLSTAHGILAAAANGDSEWTVAPAMALGESEGNADIHVSKNLASSSLLPVLETSINAADTSAQVATETVKVERLDKVVEPSWQTPFAIKLDTQGFELHVLRGGPQTLARTAVVITEMSLVPLYEGGASFVDLYRYLEQAGFRCISLAQGFCDNQRHELLQVDGVFVRDAGAPLHSQA
jgi:FkbM family methyltransferase